MKAQRKHWKNALSSVSKRAGLLLLILALSLTAQGQTPKTYEPPGGPKAPLENFYDPSDTLRIGLVDGNQVKRLLAKIQRGEQIRQRYSEQLSRGDSLLNEQFNLENEIEELQVKGKQQQKAVDAYRRQAEDIDLSARELRRKLRKEKKK